jgi:all-trans-8'-apo-beta-carotenal 15,15'-oxygenase
LILLLPRDGRGPPRWIETDAFFQFHFANGFEEEATLVVDLMRYPDYATIGEALRTYWRSNWPSKGMAALTRLRIDLPTGKVESESRAAGTANEFPRIHPGRVGMRHRYVYLASNPADRTEGLQQRLTRVDMESGAAVSHDFGPDGYPGEPVFIPANGDGDEDNGTVVTVVFDSASRRSNIVGLDARDLSARPLFVARLKHHVPYSLHGTFTTELF